MVDIYQIAEEAKERGRGDTDSSASNSPMSVSAASPQSYLQTRAAPQAGQQTSDSGDNDSTPMASAIAQVEEDRSKLSGGSGVIVSR